MSADVLVEGMIILFAEGAGLRRSRQSPPDRGGGATVAAISDRQATGLSGSGPTPTPTSRGTLAM